MSTTDKTIIEELNERIADNCQKIDTDERYDEMLDKCYSLEKVGGPFAHMSASNVLKEVDPVAYRCGKNDWLDGEDVCEVNGDYYHLTDAQDQKDDLISEIESEISDLESDIDNEDHDEEAIADFKAKLAKAQAQLESLNRHDFDK